MAELRVNVRMACTPVSKVLGMGEPGELTALEPDYLTNLSIASACKLVMIVGEEEGK